MESETYEGTMRWFGRRWDAPAFDGCPEVPTPVGEVCMGCAEPILVGEAGVTLPYFGPQGPSREPMHLECWLRSIVGGRAHLERRCSCYGGPESDDGYAREEAVEVLAYYIDSGLGRWAS